MTTSVYLTQKERLAYFAKAFQVLGDETRLQLTLFIAASAPSPVCACAFPEAFSIGRSTISYHLMKLVDVHVLTRTKRGRWSYYEIHPDFDPRILSVVQEYVERLPHHGERMSPGERTILFACVKNAGRSQLAAAMAKAFAPSGVKILSAGSDPAQEVHPEVEAVLKEMGLATEHAPQKLDPSEVKTCDWVITMGCTETCPVFPGVRYENWEIEDPHGKDMQTVRSIRDAIQLRVRDLLGRVEREAAHVGLSSTDDMEK